MEQRNNVCNDAFDSDLTCSDLVRENSRELCINFPLRIGNKPRSGAVCRSWRKIEPQYVHKIYT